MMSRDVSQMQVAIDEGLSKMKADLERGRISAKLQKQVKPMVAEAEQGVESLARLVSAGDFLKAKTLARDIQSKLYNARLIAAGKKTVS